MFGYINRWLQKGEFKLVRLAGRMKSNPAATSIDEEVRKQVITDYMDEGVPSYILAERHKLDRTTVDNMLPRVVKYRMEYDAKTADEQAADRRHTASVARTRDLINRLKF